jgi:hypothetical protein
LSALLEAIQQLNNGTIVTLLRHSAFPDQTDQDGFKTKKSSQVDEEKKKPSDPNAFEYLFLFLVQTQKAFEHCEPMIFIDGCFLSGKFGYVLLTACAMDSANHIVPLAFSIAPKENKIYWSQFLLDLKRCEYISSLGEKLTIFCDQQNGLLLSLNAIFNDAAISFCYVHMKKKFVKELCQQNEDNYRTYSSALLRYAYSLDPIEVMNACTLLKENDTFKAILEDEKNDPVLWTRFCFNDCYGRGRMGQATNNISESLNAWIRPFRSPETPFKFVLDWMFFLSELFQKRQEAANECKTSLPQPIYSKIVQAFKSDALFELKNTDLDGVKHYSVTDEVVVVVDKKKKQDKDKENEIKTKYFEVCYCPDSGKISCDCGFYEEFRYPCAHMCRVLSAEGFPLESIGQHCDESRKTKRWQSIWEQNDIKVPNREELEQLIKTKGDGMVKPALSSKAGRKPRKRIKGETDALSTHRYVNEEPKREKRKRESQMD